MPVSRASSTCILLVIAAVLRFCSCVQLTKASDPKEQANPADPSSGDNSCLKSSARGKALLVGCSRYLKLEEHRWLKGPANDVRMMHDLLVTRFCFDPKHIQVLSDSDTKADH